MLFKPKAQYLEYILFPEGTFKFLRLKFWSKFCNGLTSGSQLWEMCINPKKEIDDSKSSLIEHRYSYYLVAVQIKLRLVENGAGLDF